MSPIDIVPYHENLLISDVEASMDLVPNHPIHRSEKTNSTVFDGLDQQAPSTKQTGLTDSKTALMPVSWASRPQVLAVVPKFEDMFCSIVVSLWLLIFKGKGCFFL